MTKDGEVLTAKEAAGLLRISRGLAYEMVRQGWLPSIRLGRRILVPRRALEAMLTKVSPRPGDIHIEPLAMGTRAERTDNAYERRCSDR